MSSSIQISHPTKITNGTISLSGSKSISNRVLIIKALCEDSFTIRNISNSEDTNTLIKLLASDDLELDAGHAGTTFRFMTAYCAISGGSYYLTGSERMQNRPIGELVNALNSIGANIEYVDKESYPPLKISPSKIVGSELRLKADISSQFISSLLLIAPTLPNGLKITLESEPISRPYIEMTLSVMEYFGISHTWNDLTIQIAPQKYIEKDYYVESDWSSASYIYAIAANARQAKITIKGLSEKSIQGDNAIHKIMKSFGVESVFSEHSVTIHKTSDDPIPFYEYDFISQPDIAQTVSVVGASKGTTLLLSGLKSLSIKETDRIKALKTELQKFDVSFTKMPLKFSQKSAKQYYTQEGIATENNDAQIETYNDHRMAMAFAPLALIFPIQIEDSEVVKKSYPNFWNDLKLLGFTIHS